MIARSSDQFETVSMIPESAGEVLRAYVSASWGDPASAVGTFDRQDRAREIVADYANGRRATFRCGFRNGRRNWKITFGDVA